MIEFFKSNPGALEQLRAPLFEDKVCDFIFEQVQVDRPAGLDRGADEGPGRRGRAGTRAGRRLSPTCDRGRP